MKKFWLYLSISIFVCFILPAILTKREVKTFSQTNNIQEEQNQNKDENTSNNSNEYNYQKYGIIKLLHKSTGEVEEVAIDTYLCNGQ